MSLADLTTRPHLEVVLSKIIPAFRFSPADADVVWRFGAVLSPAVKGSVDTFQPNLPVIISRA